LLNVLLGTSLGAAILQSKDGQEVPVPLAAVLGASPLIRQMVTESCLHPAIHGPLVLTCCGVSLQSLACVVDILSTGETLVCDDNIEEVKKVMGMLGIKVNLCDDRENYDYYDYGDLRVKVKRELEMEEDNKVNIGVGLNDVLVETETSIKETIKHEHTPDNDEGISKKMDKNHHECEECGRRFGEKWTMMRHIKNVHMEKVFQCPTCEVKFGSKYNLTRHIKTVHDGIKAYECEHCGKNFSIASNRKKHIDAVHLGNRYSCTWHGGCSFTSAWKEVIEKHVRKVHNKERSIEGQLCEDKKGVVSDGNAYF